MSTDLRELARQSLHVLDREASPDIQRLRESLNEGLGQKALNSYIYTERQATANAELARAVINLLPRLETPSQFISTDHADTKHMQHAIVWREGKKTLDPYWVIGRRQNRKMASLLLHTAVLEDGSVPCTEIRGRYQYRTPLLTVIMRNNYLLKYEEQGQK
ncbi:MAG: hypothetical protein WA843_02145 [Candidatus Saccharimonadales bacterium]